MKKLIVILALMPLCTVVGQQKKAAAKPAPAASAESPKIPEGAKEVEPYLYTYTGTDGKKWFYRQTPFGVVKWEDKPVTAAPMADTTNAVVITDLGDSVRFSWATPFGTQKVVRKKSELTDDEKALMKREQDKRSDPKADDKTADAAAKKTEKP